MSYLDDNNFIKRLKTGIDTKVMLMCHNAYSYQLEKFKSVYNNLKLSIFGSGTAYARIRKKDIPDNCDFIILDGSEEYSEVEYNEIKRYAINLSEKNNKRVTAGYVYFIPVDKRVNSDIPCELIIISYKNNNENETVIPMSSDYDLLTLADIIVDTHNSLENQIIRKK